MVPQNSLVTNFLQNIFICVQQNKEIHTGLELLEGVNDDKKKNFWVNYPFKCKDEAIKLLFVCLFISLPSSDYITQLGPVS